MRRPSVLPDRNAELYDIGSPKTGFVMVEGIEFPQRVRLTSSGEIMASSAMALGLPTAPPHHRGTAVNDRLFSRPYNPRHHQQRPFGVAPHRLPHPPASAPGAASISHPPQAVAPGAASIPHSPPPPSRPSSLASKMQEPTFPPADPLSLATATTNHTPFLQTCPPNYHLRHLHRQLLHGLTPHPAPTFRHHRNSHNAPSTLTAPLATSHSAHKSPSLTT